MLCPVLTSCILRGLHLPPAMASRPQHDTVGLGDLAAATLPADSDVVSFRGRGGHPPGAFHRQSLLPNPNLAWYLLQKGHNSASSPPCPLCLTSLPLWLCAVSHLPQSAPWESRNASAGVSRMTRVCCFQECLQLVCVRRYPCFKAVSEPLHKTFSALGHSGPPKNNQISQKVQQAPGIFN